ncbi:tetratricopeptide repeat protein 5 isoform X2 [Phacochoerus africanus]|uniref:tetratricopeptide repeat protein 5 isoform X2 n=1 Tax=Phacochoerus africanus TaxID=41426 RepID=UPI001FD9221E|nr:tetratricopeptide repeat protein 5 isoform X2 [Phacochoerus africanus]
MMADEEGEVKEVLQKLQELVDQLYTFRECYFETHSVEDAGRKQQDVRKEMEKTLQQMEEVVGSIQGNAQVLMLTGKALNVTPDYSPKAEELLSKAVKLEPKLVEAWNQLGEVYWKKGDVAAAHTCFSGALTHEKVDRTASSNPDLHLNRATLHKYEENYGEALEGFFRAAALDPAWPEPRQREQQLLDFLNRLTSLLESKGKVKTKKLQSMLGSLRPAHLGPCGDGRYQSASGQKVTLERKPLSALQPGVNSGAVVLGKVVFSLTTEEKVPFTFGLVDSDGPCCAVMVYNMVQSWGVLIGDSVAIPEPNLRLHRIQHKGKDYSFSSVRVETPLLLVVNGKPQGSSSQAAATVASRPQCD